MVRLCALPGFASYKENLSILQSHSSMPVSVTRQEVSGDLQKPPTLDHLHFELLHDDQLIDNTVAVSNSIKGKKEAEKKERARRSGHRSTYTFVHQLNFQNFGGKPWRKLLPAANVV